MLVNQATPRLGSLTSFFNAPTGLIHYVRLSDFIRFESWG